MAVFLRPVQFLIYWLSGFVPRDQDLWVFGSWSGERMGDSPRIMIDHVRGADPTIRAVWITARRSIQQELSRQGFDVRMRWEPRGIWSCLRGGVYLVDGLTRDVNHWLSRGAMKVQLRHGVGVKRIERGIRTRGHRLFKLFHGTLPQRLMWSVLIPWHLPKPSIAIASSAEDAAKARTMFDIASNDVVITGLPRHDAVIRSDLTHLWTEAELGAIAALEQDEFPPFLFMPTFRDLKSGFKPSWGDLNNAAADASVALHVKLHLVDVHSGLATRETIEGYDHLRWVNPDVDPIALYRHAAGLVTDYSSVAFDFLLTSKPIVYFVPDLDAYLLGREMFWPFGDVSPGPKTTSYEELSRAMAASKDGELGEWERSYHAVRDKFHAHLDGHNAERTRLAVQRLTGSAVSRKV